MPGGSTTVAPSPIALASPAPSAASPPSLASAPTLAPRTSTTTSGSSPTSAVITHKEWIIPPRPKPGRKPATDTPPTKRKAQNRAAQRAFRERRAARVNELEDQIAVLQREKSELRRQNERLRKQLDQQSESAVKVEQIASPAPSEDPPLPPPTSNCCRGPGKDGGGCCLKRPSSPRRSTTPKRAKPNYEEIDFTTRFPAKPRKIDPCGFCSDGTPCVCLELDMSDSETEAPVGVKLPPIASMLCPPGGCVQCRADPMSTLFCQTVVASSPADIESDAGKGTYIPCSAAYQALSRHKGFRGGEALGDLVRPLRIRGEGGEGCPQVEVSSVRDVLKMLDRRFGMD